MSAVRRSEGSLDAMKPLARPAIARTACWASSGRVPSTHRGTTPRPPPRSCAPRSAESNALGCALRLDGHRVAGTDYAVAPHAGVQPAHPGLALVVHAIEVP